MIENCENCTGAGRIVLAVTTSIERPWLCEKCAIQVLKVLGLLRQPYYYQPETLDTAGIIKVWAEEER